MLDVENLVRMVVYSVLRDKYSVFEDVPADARLPYVVIGESTTTNNSTKTDEGAIISLTLHVFSEYQGYKELANLVNGIVNLLNATELFVDDKQIWIFLDSVEFEEASSYKHGIIKLKIHVYEGV